MYQDNTGQSSCKSADAGYYSPGTTGGSGVASTVTTIASSQTQCAAGTYQPSTGQTSCIDADAGFFVANAGSTSQTACAAGTYSATTGKHLVILLTQGTTLWNNCKQWYHHQFSKSTSSVRAGTYQASSGETLVRLQVLETIPKEQSYSTELSLTLLLARHHVLLEHINHKVDSPLVSTLQPDIS